MVKMAEWHKPGDDPEDNNRQALGLEIWRNLQKITGQLSQELCEQLRLVNLSRFSSQSCLDYFSNRLKRQS